MKTIIFYLISFLLLILYAFIAPNLYDFPFWLIEIYENSNYVFIGGLGGILYCLRAVYLNKCVKMRWDDDWEVWYYIRPICSLIVGLIAFFLIKAGLLVLDANQGTNSYGYLFFSFIAGYNVDNILKKIESISENIWGIKKSNSSSD